MPMKKSSYGYAKVPRDSRRMLLVRYDLFPFMLVHQAHRLTDGSYRWVSGWFAGHQNFGVYSKDSPGLLAVLPVEEGKQLEDELKQLGNLYREYIKAVDSEFVMRRNRLLAQYRVSANRLTIKRITT